MEELKYIFLFLILVTPLVVIVLLVRRNAQRYAEGPFASQRIEGGSNIAETSLGVKSDVVANADVTNVTIDEKSNLAVDRSHRKHDDTSENEHDKSESPYSTWWTLFATYCLFMLCTLLLEEVDPDLAGYAIIIINFVFFLRLIVIILRNATRKTSHFRWYKVKEGIDYNRWGEFILDPDVSHYDYFELRRMDPTLPKSDPRGPNSFGDTTVLRTMEPYWKWLHFSTDLGSYEKRCEMYYGYGSHDSKKRQRLLRKLDPTLLTDKEKEVLNKRRVQASTYFNYIELEEQIESRSNENQFAPSLIPLKVRHRAGKILFSEAFTVTLFIVLLIVGLYFVGTKEVLPAIAHWSERTTNSYWAAIGFIFFVSLYVQYKSVDSSKSRELDTILFSSILGTVILSIPTAFAVNIIAEHGWALLYIPVFLLTLLFLLYVFGVIGERK